MRLSHLLSEAQRLAKNALQKGKDESKRQLEACNPTNGDTLNEKLAPFVMALVLAILVVAEVVGHSPSEPVLESLTLVVVMVVSYMYRNYVQD